jgi:hypothetical protein
MSERDERDLEAELDELRARQEWAEESIRVLAEAVQRLAEETRPNPVTHTTRKLLTSRLEQALGRESPRE